jgi:ketosteroid isomerase-like protein
LRSRLVVLLMSFALLLIAGCSGQWANNGGGGQGGGQGRNRPHATEDETRQAFEKVMGAFARKDAAALNEMMSPSAIFIDPPIGPGVFAWSDAKPILEQSFAKGPNFQLTNDSGYSIGVERDLGWIATVFHVRVPFDHGVLQSDGGISMLFQKTEGGYKVLMFHASRFPAAAPATAAKSDQGNAPPAKTPAAQKK